MVYLALKFLDVKILVNEMFTFEKHCRRREGAEMTPSITIEVHRQLHADRTAQLHASMHRPWQLAPRRRLGTWLVAAGIRLAPEARQALSQTEAPTHAGASVRALA
jgi:hypothetical protein